MTITWRPRWFRETRARQADTPKIDEQLSRHVATLQSLTVKLDQELAKLRTEVRLGE